MRVNIILILVFLYCPAFAQKKAKKQEEDFISTKTDSIENDIFNPKDLEVKEEKKEKKPKKNFYYGHKTKKFFIRSNAGGKEIVELFNVLKEYKDPNSFLQDVFWYSGKENKIKNAIAVDKENARILHGPYIRLVDGDTVEEGQYYVGAKHGRWAKYKKGYVLEDKNTYFRGWPNEAKITYYDGERTKIKEVLPVKFGKIEGDYFLFYDNGMIAEEGVYKNGVKIGKWIEYYKIKKRRKVEMQYAKDPYDITFEPYKMKEWNEKGTITFDWEQEKKRSAAKKN